jgi:hypothetical protein
VPLRSLRFVLTFVLLLPCMITLPACASDPTAPEPLNVGPVSGRWNQQIWSGSGFAIQTGDSLRIIGQRPDPFYYYHEAIVVALEFGGVGEYLVPGRMESVVGGDGIVSASGEATVVISDYIPATADRNARVRGSVTLISNDPMRTWRFESGTFDVPIFERWEDAPCVVCRPGIN